MDIVNAYTAKRAERLEDEGLRDIADGECGGGGEVSGGDMGTDERMEDINGKMGNRNTPTEAGKVSGDISSRYVRTAS